MLSRWETDGLLLFCTPPSSKNPPEVSFWGEEKHLKLMVVVVVLIYEYTKIYYFCCFNFIEVYLIYHVLVSGV